MRMENGKWYCETCGAREKELYRPCVPRDDSGDHDSRLQADVEAVNDFLSTCGDGPTGPPVFVAEENKELGHVPQVSEMLHVQDSNFQAITSTEAEPLENPRAGNKKVEKGIALTVPRTLRKSPGTLEAMEGKTRAQKARTRTVEILFSRIAAGCMAMWKALRLRLVAMTLDGRNRRDLPKEMENQCSVMSSGLKNQCAVT